MQPNISVGLATKLMALIGSLFGVITAVSVIAHGELSQDSVVTLVLSATSFFVLAGGRYAQAALGALNRHLSEAYVDIPPSSDAQLIDAGVLDDEDAEDAIPR